VTTPDDIASTRAELSRDIDELTDKVSPTRVVERRKEAVRGRFGSLRDTVMGKADQVRGSAGATGSSMGQSASSAAGSVSDKATGALDTVGSKAEGNPLAAGLVPSVPACCSRR